MSNHKFTLQFIQHTTPSILRFGRKNFPKKTLPGKKQKKEEGSYFQD